MKKAFLIVFGLLASAGCQAEIYKCTKNDGKIEFTSIPCSSGKKEVVGVRGSAKEEVNYKNFNDLMDNYRCDNAEGMTRVFPTKESFERLAEEYLSNPGVYKSKLNDIRRNSPSSGIIGEGQLSGKLDDGYMANGKACTLVLKYDDSIGLGFYSTNEMENKKIAANTLVNSMRNKGYNLKQESMSMRLNETWVGRNGYKCWISFVNDIEEFNADIECKK